MFYSCLAEYRVPVYWKAYYGPAYDLAQQHTQPSTYVLKVKVVKGFYNKGTVKQTNFIQCL